MAPIAIGTGIGPTFGGGGASAPAFNPVSLFAAEQGVIRDLTSSANVFQERTGASATTPSGNGGPVGSLKDLSPNANWGVAPSDAARPTYDTAGFLLSDGTDDRLGVAFTLAQTFVRITCMRLVSFVNNQRLWDGNTFNSCGLLQSTGPLAQMFAGVLGGAIALTVGADCVITERFSGATSRIAKDNGAYSTLDAGTQAAAGDSLCSGAGTTFSNIRIYRRFVIARDMTDPEIASVRTWAGAAAGLVL